ncbi:carboxypeptidase-like regulatory domain-containing protein [Polyangium jinanense]|uniref:Carboxypeptidase regulatory-like domain-containing protein n=1 Tax=Polyangium jinanense TaxID=2829994 RepID=A0A9X3X817_9BACT|nr:carboxypeptidase-like regulatory domain-containing protein [Polyangium jinanense]MDC3960918.1 carboxypeptidase regulatory-like domain-containing protein [Polyangium jinanense]MDC3984475.1 carboxypeptidase regulatory-like domain-containing protein [Polyangium jinanense]
MTIVNEVFSVVSWIFGSTDPRRLITGRVIDPIGVPLVGASVRMLATGAFSGSELSVITTDDEGRFELDGAAAPDEYLIIIEAREGERRIVETRRPPYLLGDVQLPVPFRLTASVGDGGDNRPHDVRRVQDRLHRLGRLTDADVAAEPIDLAASPPMQPGPRLLAALATHFTASFGRPLPSIRVEPTGPTVAALAMDPPFPLIHIGLSSAVGELPDADASVPRNEPASFAAVQERLQQLGRLSRAQHVAEYTDVTAAGPVALATKPQTMAAIMAFDRDVAGGALRAIVPGARNEHLLNDPFVFGRQPLPLTASVGTHGRNRPADIRRVQDGLHRLGFLSGAAHQVERAVVAATNENGRVADTSIPQTLAAISALRQTRLGEPAPAPSLVDPVDSALQRLNRPPRLELTGMVGWGPAMAAANRPPDVRRLQERLLLLGFLSQADFDAERADPYATERIDQADVVHTAVALSLVSEQRGPLVLTSSVGAGAVNARADVRAVQDRLRGLRFLAEADHQSEAVDLEGAGPLDVTTLVATFAAIEQLRRRVFELPPAADLSPWTAQRLIEPGDETHQLLVDPLHFGRHPLNLTGSVGTYGWNFPADVRALQERLHAMRLLADPDFEAEAVDPARAGRISDSELVATRKAIRRFRASLLGEAAPVLERVEARSPELVALEDRLGALRTPIELVDSVGYDGNNTPGDVLQIQRRLHGLGFLTDEDFDVESRAVPDAEETRLHDHQIAYTIAAIGDWQALMLGAPQQPRVAPFSETLRSLIWPVIPRSVQLTLGDKVGTAGVNARADVRPVQDRLFELGLLGGVDYFVERVDPSVGGSAPVATLTATIAAIGLLQQTLAGLAAKAPDFVINPGAGGRARRILEDPAFSTPTAPNPNCVLVFAGPKRPTFADADLTRLIRAIEAVEGGVSTGEIPALLRNASGTPASWGSAQVVGSKALDTLLGSTTFATFYGLSTTRLQALRDRAVATVERFEEITAAVAANTTEAALKTQIAAYVTAHAAAVRATTGLGPDDIEAMFRTGQLRRHLLALGTGGNAAVLCNPTTHPHAAANIARLRLAQSDVETYLREPYFEEHKQGFVNRSIFLTPEGQLLRNALTDDTGFKMGRHAIRSNWNTTGSLGLDARTRAQITAYMHNKGGAASTLAGDLDTVADDDYVKRVMNRYDALP